MGEPLVVSLVAFGAPAQFMAAATTTLIKDSTLKAVGLASDKGRGHRILMASRAGQSVFHYVSEAKPFRIRTVSDRSPDITSL